MKSEALEVSLSEGIIAEKPRFTVLNTAHNFSVS